MIGVQQPLQPAAPQQSEEEPPFIAAAPLFQTLHPEKRKKRKPNLLFGLIATAAVGGGLLWLVQSHRSTTSALAAPLPPAAAAPAAAASFSPAAVPQPATETPTAAVASAPAVATPQPAPATPQSAAPAVANTKATPSAMGKLAVSSPIAAEIYEGSHQLGSTPTTLDLPAGRHTLEYRHGDLRTTMNHEIKSGGTTTASITFQTTVQINAKPWAQVFLDGNSRRLLGQTPLSGVTVPIGGVLVFENPGFASQTRRITESETTIQVELQ
jgi:hypothetical protein